MEFINHKISIPKHKDKTFEQLAIYILQNDKKYITTLFRTLNNPRTNPEKKQEISNFINFFTQFEKNYSSTPSSPQPQQSSWIPPEITIQTPIQQIKHIFHISDIHIRLYQREKEYNEVFQKLYDFIQENSSYHEIIIITGDLLHSKNQLSPECIITTQNFLINLAKICPTFLIAGNHDALLNNEQRKDSITAIVEKANIPNFYYLKDSGVYYFANLSISVNSLLDNQWVHANNFQPPQHIQHKIALFHGGVGLVETGVGHRLKGEKLIEDFQGYDFTLLGDIHKYQWLVPKRMAYSSSLIAQNFSEWNHPHGVLIWDLQHLNHHYHPIPNNSGFFVFNLTNNQVLVNNEIIQSNTIPDYLQSISSCLNVKLNIQNCSHQFISEISNIIQNCSSNPRIIQNHLSTSTNNSQHINEEATYDSNQLQTLLTSYLQENHPNLSPTDKQFILQKYQEISSNSTILNEKNLSKWELIDIQFSNLFGYGPNNYINFQQFSSESPIGIIAPNSHGKSSLIDIILFTLFSKFSRSRGTAISKDIINIQANNFQSTLRFRIGTDIYTIHKEGKREQSNRIKINKNTFHKNQENLSDENRIKTDKIITELIGTYDDLVFTNIQLQNKQDSFKDMSDKERKEHLYKILKLDIWNSIISQMKETTKPIKSQINYLEKRIENTNLQNIKNLIQNSGIKINILNDAIEQQLYEKQINLEYIQTISEKIQPYPSQNHNLPEINHNINALEENLKLINTRIINDSEKLIECKNTISKLSLINNSKNIQNNYQIQNKKYNTQITELENQLKSITILSLISTSYYEEKFQNTNPEEILNNIQQNIENINLQKNKENLHKTQQQLQEEIEKNNKIQNEISILKSQLKENLPNKKDLTHQYQDLSQKLKNKQKEKNIVQDKINNIQEILENYNLSQIQQFEKEIPIHTTISQMEDKLQNLHSILQKLENHQYNPKCKHCINNPITQQKIQTSNEINQLTKEIHNKKQSLIIAFSEINHFMKQTNEVASLKEKLITKKNKIPILENTITKYQLDIEKIQMQINNITNNENITTKIINLQKSINLNNTNSLKTQVNKLQSIIDNSQSYLQQLLQNKQDAINYQNITQQNKEIQSTNNILIQQISNFKTQINNAKNKWENSKEYQQYQQLQTETHNQIEIQSNINDLNMSISKLSIEKESSQNKLINNKNILKELQNSSHIQENNQKLRQKIKEYQSRIEINDNIISQKNAEIGKINQLVSSNRDALKEYLKMSDELEVTKKEFNLLKILELSLNKDGLPLKILKHFLPPITQQINNIISPFISRKINLKIENEDLILDSFPNQNADKSVFMHGGMESFILDIAFKITLSNFAKLPKCNILFLDEGISAFDSQRLSNIDILFSFIANYFDKTILITHIDSVKDNIQEKITIQKINDLSQITCEYLK